MTRIYDYPRLLPGALLRRYKRFLADVELDTGEVVTAFCPNSGSMIGLVRPGTPAMLSISQNPERKTLYTLEMLKPGRTWVGVNTLLTNNLAERLLESGLALPSPDGFDSLKREASVGNSRLDFLLTRGGQKTYVEVKSVTLRVGDEARFPDAVTLRGRKHLETLIDLRKNGDVACMLYVVQRGDCLCFSPAGDIDPGYANTLREAIAAGVGVHIVGLKVSPKGIYYLKDLGLCRA